MLNNSEVPNAIETYCGHHPLADGVRRSVMKAQELGKLQAVELYVTTHDAVSDLTGKVVTRF